jgi:S1-C subfamily serine protease
VVTNVKDVSPAGEANINEGDVISEVQGTKITSVEQFKRTIEGFKSGQFIRMYVTTPSRSGRPFASYRVVQIP